MKNTQDVISLFDGGSCGQVALNRAKIGYRNYYASEIDKYAIQVTQDNWEDTIQLGDILNWRNWDIDWSNVGLVMGGSPCQGFSFAGKQLAFDDPRSKLFFVFVEILEHVRKFNPDVKFLLENVRMKKEYLDVISEYMGIEPVFINSALVSAQNRQRYYWTDIPGVTIPEDKGITWGDVREHGVVVESFYYTDAAMQWLGRHSRSKGKKFKIHEDNEKMQMLEASHHKKYSSQRFFGIIDTPPEDQVVGAMRGRYLVNGKRQDGRMLTKGKTQQYIEFRHDGKTNALTTVGKDNVVVPFTLPERIPASEFFFRYITPLECERLQTVPDNYTKCVSNTQRYRIMGNGWTSDVIAHIFQGLA